MGLVPGDVRYRLMSPKLFTPSTPFDFPAFCQAVAFYFPHLDHNVSAASLRICKYVTVQQDLL